jgi:peptide chain release factor 1
MVIVEIRAAEGGDDAKQLVFEQFRIYSNMANRKGYELEPLAFQDGFVSFRARDADDFKNEAGGHRWQRVPPNERRGRVHTSTITVAVMPVPQAAELKIAPSDLEITTTRGTGPGGQARNKTESCVVITHRPSGLVVRCDSQRSQTQNKEAAMDIMRATLLEQQRAGAKVAEDRSRRAQVGSGQRGDKIRTIRIQDGIVTDHRLGRKVRFADYERGDLSEFQR